MNVLSAGFLALLSAVVALYWGRQHRAWQNGLLLAASLGFVASWSLEALAVLLLSTAFEWRIARQVHLHPGPRGRTWMLAGVAGNLLLFLFFRSRAFYVAPLSAFATRLGLDPSTLTFLVPIGLSFWTLQKMTLTLDVRLRGLAPGGSFGDFLLQVSFFPTLVSGPIERIRDLRPRFAVARTWNARAFSEGIWLLALGAFEKTVVADHLAPVVHTLFEGHPGAPAIALGIIAYGLQLFADFAGYSDMARGIGRLFGIELTENFRAPYLARNLSEYWKRWHVSLSSWLNDYVFAPTAFRFRSHGTRGIVIATVVTFLISGLWHGTGWQFLAWGAIHATGLSFLAIFQKRLKRLRKRHEARCWYRFACRLTTLSWVGLGYVFFLAPSLPEAIGNLSTLLQGKMTALPSFHVHVLLLSLLAVGALHWARERFKTPFWAFLLPMWPRTLLYLGLGLLLLRFHAHATNFLYFQF